MQTLTRRTKWFNALTILSAWALLFGSSILGRIVFDGKNFDLKFALELMATGVLQLTVLVVMYVSIYRCRRQIVSSPKKCATMYAILTLGALFDVFSVEISVYAMPVTFVALLCGIFFDERVSFECNVFLTAVVLISAVIPDFADGMAIELLDVRFYTTILAGFVAGSLITLLVGRDTRRINFILLGILFNLVAAWIVVLFGAVDSDLLLADPEELYYLPSMIFLPVVLGLLLQPVLEHIFNVTSNFRLVELTDPRHPLMRQLQREAPGTYNHCLTVANLVETCAAAIGENVYMARAAAYYHDIGKLKNPSMFAENQTGEHSIHDELTPEASTDIIRKHALNGEQMCREWHIPAEIAQIALEHHGTTVIAYFYNKAKEMTDGRDVDIKDFSYPGPIPSTRIAGLVMICDACEAAVRANNTRRAEEVDKLVDGIINARLRTGQFDNCPLTMRDLNVVRFTIVNAICGLYHERIQYPKAEEN